MPLHHRYATRHEIARILSTPDTTESDFAAVLDALADCGAPVDALVKVFTDKDGKAQAIEVPIDVDSGAVDLTERPEDTVRRFAGDLEYAKQLLLTARALLEGEVSGEATDDFLMRVKHFPHKPEGEQQ